MLIERETLLSMVYTSAFGIGFLNTTYSMYSCWLVFSIIAVSTLIHFVMTKSHVLKDELSLAVRVMDSSVKDQFPLATQLEG